jgi:hypothetical protein
MRPSANICAICVSAYGPSSRLVIFKWNALTIRQAIISIASALFEIIAVDFLYAVRVLFRDANAVLDH